MKNTNKIVTIVLNVLFCAALIWFFSRNCFLRPYSGSMWKEALSGVMLLATLYINYFLLYPLLVERKHSRTLYWLAVGVMLLAISLLELTIAHRQIMICNGALIELIGFYSFFSKLLAVVFGRNLFFNFFSYLFRERKQLQDALDNEVRIVYQEVRKLDVVDQNNKLILIPIDDIYYCRQDGNYTRIYTVDNIWYSRLGSMIHLEQLFGDEEFVRISSTLLVPYKYIASCEGNEVVMKRMPWTRNPLTFTIDTKNSNEISERIANHLASVNPGHRRDAPWHVSTSGRKRRHPINPSQEKKETVFAYIQSHPGCRSTEIIAGTALSQSTVERCLAELRKQGRVEYEGSKKNGGYRTDTMKKTLTVLLCAVLSVLTSFAQNPIPAHFDECVDLVATVWRLSGAREYNLCTISQYTHEIDSVFAPYKEHQVVQLARQYPQESGIGYDAVASYALHLTMTENGDIVLNDNFAEGGDASFDRWTEQQKKDFLEPLNDFYRTSHFHEWYLRQKDFYAQVEEAFEAINQKIDYDWFNSYFGQESGSTFRIVLSLLVGPNNYGCSARMKDGSNALSPVIGCCQVDDNGNIYYNANAVLPIVIHEFCHHYCNPLNNQFWSLMSKSAEKVYKEREEQMRRSAYGSAQTMMNETFVRASVIRYMRVHYPQVEESALVKAEEEEGFILTQTLCEALKQYEQQRNKYATMTDFMPVYAQIVNDFDLKLYLKQYKKQQKELAKLNATFKVNLKNGAKDVPSGLYTLVIKFSKPMANSIALYHSTSGAEFPPVKSYAWSDDKTLEVIFLLEPSHQYGFAVMGTKFSTKDGHSAGKNMEINFMTGN